MKIILDENRQIASLVKNDGTVISTNTFKNLIKNKCSLEYFREKVNKFNEETLSKQEEFDDIEKLGEYIQIHNF